MIKEQLPPFMIADLYKNALTIIEEENKSTTKEKITNNTDTLNFLGENNKKITILVAEENTLHLQEDSYHFITNILAACKLNMADVAIVNCEQPSITWNEIQQTLTPTICIVFGNILSKINFTHTLNLYQPQTFHQTTFLLSAALPMLKPSTQEAKLEKSKLWICLKKMFNV